MTRTLLRMPRKAAPLAAAIAAGLLLPAAVVDARPLGVIIIGVAFDPLGFQPLHFPLLTDRNQHVRGDGRWFQAEITGQNR